MSLEKLVKHVDSSYLSSNIIGGGLGFSTIVNAIDLGNVLVGIGTLVALIGLYFQVRSARNTERLNKLQELQILEELEMTRIEKKILLKENPEIDEHGTD